MKKIILNIVLIIGIMLILYPIVGSIVNKINQSFVITRYKEQIKEMNEEDVEKQKKEYERYNQSLAKDKISYINLLKAGEYIGYLEIEKINVYLPIYEGSSKDTLLQGIGHLENTSLPTYNGDYHCVLVGHTGLSAKKMFDDLPKLKNGDKFYVTILDETFEYLVSNIQEVLPDETDSLKIQKDKKLVTLVTCVPKYINSHRLLVTGEKL